MTEVEKESMQPVFFFLQDMNINVFVDPTADLLEKYIQNEKEPVIIKSLISEAPIQKLNGINTTTLEKLLVDAFCEADIFSSQQGQELQNIFMEAMSKYTVNKNRLLRYASRRNKKTAFSEYINSLVLNIQ